MASFASPDSHKTRRLSSGVQYSYVHVPASSSKPTILFLHGFPSTSYDWHHQIAYFKNKGYGIIAPDLLGYGGTDKPAESSAYRLKKICEEVLEIMDGEGVDKVLGVGHDWGSMLLGRMANYFPERFISYTFVCVGYRGPGGKVDAEKANKMLKPMLGYEPFGYFMFFKEPDAVELMERNHESTDSLFLGQTAKHWQTNICTPGAARAWLEAGRVEALPPWMDETTIQTRREITRAGGYLGPLNWYRQAQTDVNDKDENALPESRREIVDRPVLLVMDSAGEGATPPEVQKQATAEACKNLRMVEVESGHYMMLQNPAGLNAELDKFFDEVTTA